MIYIILYRTMSVHGNMTGYQYCSMLKNIRVVESVETVLIDIGVDTACSTLRVISNLNVE
jgi:hypothetical protein